MSYSFTKHVIFFHQFHFFAPTLRTFCVYVLHTFFWQFLLFDSHFRLLLILVKRLMVLTIQFSLFFPHHLQPFTVFQYEAPLQAISAIELYYLPDLLFTKVTMGSNSRFFNKSRIHLIHGLRTPREEIPSLNGRKFTPTPKFLVTAEAYFVCHIGPNFQISLIYAFIGCPQSVLQ